MRGFSKAIITGNLTRDPELRNTPNGASVCSFSVAVNRTYRDASGEQKEDVSFIDCSAWGKLAEMISQYAKKVNKDVGNIRRLLIQKRLNGIKIGNQWVISSDERYPEDKRITSGKYLNYRKKLALNKHKKLIFEIKQMIKEIASNINTDLIKAVIYGSYARGEETSESDVDIALFLDKTDNSIRDIIVRCAAKYELITDKVLTVIDIDNSTYEKMKDVSPFYININKEGIVLWNKE